MSNLELKCIEKGSVRSSRLLKMASTFCSIKMNGQCRHLKPSQKSASIPLAIQKEVSKRAAVKIGKCLKHTMFWV